MELLRISFHYYTLNQDWEHRAHTHKVITKRNRQKSNRLKKKRNIHAELRTIYSNSNARRQEEIETNDKTNKICVQIGICLYIILYHIVRLVYNWNEKEIKRTHKWDENAWIELKMRTIFTFIMRFGYIFNQFVAYAYERKWEKNRTRRQSDWLNG